jgi:hypothetical protein
MTVKLLSERLKLSQQEVHEFAAWLRDTGRNNVIAWALKQGYDQDVVEGKWYDKDGNEVSVQALCYAEMQNEIHNTQGDLLRET